MDADTTPSELPAIGLLTDLDEATRRVLAAAGRYATLPAGASIAVQGEPNHTLTVLLNGRAAVHCHAHGDSVHLANLKAGDTIGEMNLLDPQKASADVKITEKAQAWQIDAEQFQSLVKSDPALGVHILQWLGRQLSRRLRRDADHMLRQAQETRSRFRDIDY
jgi:CRP/FNR family transcriptional regulator, cyclic AMP receptor protein